MPRFQIAGHAVTLDDREVEKALERVQPEPLREHYVVVKGRRFPPKQVLGIVTGIDRADFTTHQARRILRRLGFPSGRKSSKTKPTDDNLSLGPHGGRQAKALEPFIGKWVALGEPDEVLVSGETLEEVVKWLVRHDKKSWGVFRVPRSEADIPSGAPF